MSETCEQCGGTVYTDPGDEFHADDSGTYHTECWDYLTRESIRAAFVFAGTPEFYQKHLTDLDAYEPNDPKRYALEQEMNP